MFVVPVWCRGNDCLYRIKAFLCFRPFPSSPPLPGYHTSAVRAGWEPPVRVLGLQAGGRVVSSLLFSIAAPVNGLVFPVRNKFSTGLSPPPLNPSKMESFHRNVTAGDQAAWGDMQGWCLARGGHPIPAATRTRHCWHRLAPSEGKEDAWRCRSQEPWGDCKCLPAFL